MAGTDWLEGQLVVALSPAQALSSQEAPSHALRGRRPWQAGGRGGNRNSCHYWFPFRVLI